MTIHWSLFAPGVLLLLFPADRLLSSTVELRSFDGFQNLDNSPRYRPWWWVPVLWLDPLRGFFGAIFLTRAMAIRPETWELTPKPAYALIVGVLALGVLSQTFTRRGEEGELLAPVGFVAGVVAALTFWPVALIGIATAILGLCAFRHFQAFFIFGLAAIALLGVVLDADAGWVAAASGAFALPVVAGFVTGRTLKLPTRNASGRLRPTRLST